MGLIRILRLLLLAEWKWVDLHYINDTRALYDCLCCWTTTFSDNLPGSELPLEYAADKSQIFVP